MALEARVRGADPERTTQESDNARERSREANHRLTEALTDQIRDRYGATVRFRRIRKMRFED
jgi:hypothetical protein